MLGLRRPDTPVWRRDPALEGEAAAGAGAGAGAGASGPRRLADMQHIWFLLSDAVPLHYVKVHKSEPVSLAVLKRILLG